VRLRDPGVKLETASKADRGTVSILAIPTIIALWFVNSSAFTYLTVGPESYGIYKPRHDWLYAHIVAGIVALLFGPVQLWLGANHRTAFVHRILGSLYVMSVGVAGISAFYLAAHTDFGWVFGVGLATGALVWMISTFFAVVAISRKMVEEHRNWMIRSCVFTFVFVTFRVITGILKMFGIGTMLEQMTAASWLSWSLPFMITEFVLLGRKLFVRMPKPAKSTSIIESTSSVDVFVGSQDGVA